MLDWVLLKAHESKPENIHGCFYAVVMSRSCFGGQVID